MIWEEYYDESDANLQKAWEQGVLGLRELNVHVLEDLEDYILLKGFGNLSNAEIQKMIDANLIERRQRLHMRLIEEAKENATAEETKEG